MAKTSKGVSKVRVRLNVGIYLVPPLMSGADNIASTRNFFQVVRTEVFETHRNCASGCSNHLTQNSPNGLTCALEQSAWQRTLMLFMASPIERWTQNAILRLAAGRWRISYRLLFLVRIGPKLLVGRVDRGGEGVV